MAAVRFRDIFKLEMIREETAQRRRLLIVWILTVVLCAAAVSATLLVQPLHGRVLGLDVDASLSTASYIALFVMGLTTFRWFQTMPRRTKRITVRELRKRAGYGD